MLRKQGFNNQGLSTKWISFNLFSKTETVLQCKSVYMDGCVVSPTIIWLWIWTPNPQILNFMVSWSIHELVLKELYKPFLFIHSFLNYILILFLFWETARIMFIFPFRPWNTDCKVIISTNILIRYFWNFLF